MKENKRIVRIPHAFGIANEKMKKGMKGNTKKIAQSILLLNKTFARGSGMMEVPKCRLRGRIAPSSNLTSYVVTICASMDFISFAAKKRPGLSDDQNFNGP